MWCLSVLAFECVRNKYRDLFLEQTKLIQFMNTKKVIKFSLETYVGT